MNPPNVTTAVFSQPPINSSSIDSVELSIKKLIKSCYTRLQWQQFLNPKEQNLNRAPWRNHLANFLESTKVRVLTILLLLLDLIFTVLELSSSLLSCGQKNKHHSEQVLYHWAEIVVLTLLSAKIVGLVIGLGSSFFRRPVYVIDGIVVIGAVILEAFLEGKGGGLLMVVSLWRVVRVVESAFELSDEAIEAQIEGIASQFEALRDDNIKLKETIDEKDKIIEKLQEELNQFSRISHHIQ